MVKKISSIVTRYAIDNVNYEFFKQLNDNGLFLQTTKYTLAIHFRVSNRSSDSSNQVT